MPWPLAVMKAAGLHVIDITGQPLGWSESLARTRPVDAIVAENEAAVLIANESTLYPAATNIFCYQNSINKMKRHAESMRPAINSWCNVC